MRRTTTATDPNGSYVGGDGAGPSAYEIGDIITLSGGFEVTVALWMEMET